MPSSERRHTLHGRVTNETERALLAAANGRGEALRAVPAVPVRVRVR
jgi:hypothetical protein